MLIDVTIRFNDVDEDNNIIWGCEDTILIVADSLCKAINYAEKLPQYNKKDKPYAIKAEAHFLSEYPDDEEEEKFIDMYEAALKA